MHNQLDRISLQQRIDKNLRLASSANDPAVRDLHSQYVELYRHLLKANDDMAAA